MNNEYEYYLKYVKPLETKYNKLKRLYHIFKLPSLKKECELINKILVLYYNDIQNNKIKKESLKKNFK